MNRRLTAQTFHIWTRNKHRINLSCPFAVVIACFIALYLTLSSFALTGSQKRISYLDGHDASITISQTQTTLRPAQGTVIDRLRKSGARNISVITTGSSFQIDGLRTTGLSTGFHDRIQYMEWASGSPASRYHLTTGHWPPVREKLPCPSLWPHVSTTPVASTSSPTPHDCGSWGHFTMPTPQTLWWPSAPRAVGNPCLPQHPKDTRHCRPSWNTSGMVCRSAPPYPYSARCAGLRLTHLSHPAVMEQRSPQAPRYRWPLEAPIS
ncbi:hypothetical protein JCM18918_1328 [Cutibacterium acnes JCM 18918]|nr:hypothetical protein JCM18918_1328 [Cutibacterium acnes JCM 18918]